MTEREFAFLKMSTRINERFKIQLDDIFQNMAYQNISQGEIDKIIEKIDIEIREKAENARKYIRPMFDKQETTQENEELKNQGFNPNQKDQPLQLHYPDTPITDKDDIIGISTIKELDEIGFHV